MKKLILSTLILCSAIGLSAQSGEKNYFRKEYIKEVMNKAAVWQLQHPKHEPNDWTNGAFYAGVFAAWQTTKSPVLYKAMMALGNDSTQWRPGRRWYHADDIAICQTYIDLYRIEKQQRMIQPTIDTVKLLLERDYPTRGNIDVIKWWWCDALFMGPPVLVKLGVTLNDPTYFAYNDRYFKECYDLLYDKEEHLFARDLNYVIKNDGNDRYEANGKKIFWSRGNG